MTSALSPEEKHARHLKQMKEWRKRNKAHIIEYSHKWFMKNGDRRRAQARLWSKTESGRKCQRIQCWKKHGIIHEDYDKLYEQYMNAKECENCSIPLTFGWHGDARCVDHCHETGQFRNILCRVCNTLRRD